jgi:hypothetical protein
VEKTMGKNKIVLILIMVTLLSFGSVNALSNSTRADAEQAIIMAETQMKDMNNLGFQINRVNDTINEARRLLTQNNYIGAETMANYVNVVHDSAIEANYLMDEAEKRIYLAETGGLNATAANVLLEAGIEDFYHERYEDAKNNFEQAINKIDELESTETLKKNIQTSESSNILATIRDNIQSIALVIVVFVVTIFVVLSIFAHLRKKNRLSRLKKNLESTKNAIINLQNEYFKKNSISDEDYQEAMKRYKQDTTAINREITALEIKNLREKNDNTSKGNTKIKKN